MKRRRPPDWPAIAERLAGLVPPTALHPGALRMAGETLGCEPRGGARRALAFSGGADSLALLLILWAGGAGRRGRDLVALHFNHRLRGRAAAADEKFCAQVCAALGVKFVAGRWEGARKEAGEAEARAARFAFLHREMARRRLRILWLGHQQDDIAEAMLMRLARGSGTAGLAAPRPAQAMPGGRWHLRPMLTLKKADIEAALRAAGATWRVDGSNATPRFFRNRIRRAVMPAWIEAAGRDSVAGAARARELLEEDDVALEAWVEKLAPLRKDNSLSLSRLAGFPRAVWRRALHRWLGQTPGAGRHLSRQAVDALLDRAISGAPTRQSLGVQTFAVIRGGRLRCVSGARK